MCMSHSRISQRWATWPASSSWPDQIHCSWLYICVLNLRYVVGCQRDACAQDELATLEQLVQVRAAAVALPIPSLPQIFQSAAVLEVNATRATIIAHHVIGLRFCMPRPAWSSRPSAPRRRRHVRGRTFSATRG